MAVQKDILENAGVPAQDVQRLEAAWTAYQSAKGHPARDIPCIVCTGIYNAGKSTLLNALTGTEQFPTGDVPTTKAVAQAELDGAVYIDTPGLNAAEADDMETQAAYEVADFILFVSSAVSGGISQAEAQWLRTLGGRYDLNQRLIFVLTKCGQAGPEELSGITERFRQDLEKTAGVREVIPVDSITYQKGVAEGKALLVEHSGIPALKDHLAEKIAAADRLLIQAREEERVQRRREVLEQIEQVQTVLQEKKDQASRKNLEQIAAVDRVWAEFEESLRKMMPSEGETGFITAGPVNLNYRSGSYIKERSESAARRRLEERLKSYYDKRERAAKDAIFRYMPMSRIRSEWCSTGPDSVYASRCSRINQIFESVVLNLQKLGSSISPVMEISVAPDLPSSLAGDLEQDLNDDLVDYGGYYSLSKYVEMYADISEMEEYVSGAFGIRRQVEMYNIYHGSSVVSEIEKDLKSNVDRNAKSANRTVNRYWQDFRKKLEPEVASRKSALKRQVDVYRSSLANAAAAAPVREALTHLETLEREVRQ